VRIVGRQRWGLLAVIGIVALGVGFKTATATQGGTPQTTSQTTSQTSSQTPSQTTNLTVADIDRLMKQVSNWGRWGKDDQRGAVNLITAAKRKQAAALVKAGISVSLSHNPSTEKTVDNPSPLELTFSPRRPGSPVALDTWRVAHHGFTFSHLDALCHWFYQGKMFNGFDESEVTAQGCGKNGIEAMKEGILTRGVLIDIPRLKHVPYLEPGTRITREDLDAWVKMARVTITSGDAVLVRTGRWGRRAVVGPFSVQQLSAGLHVSTVPFFKEHDVAVMGSDVGLDVTPFGVDGVVNPVHTLVIAGMGVAVLDNADLESLAETAARLNRWEFMFSGAPIPVTGASGSLLNAIATF